MKVFVALLALMAVQANAGVINTFANDVSQIAVAGHEAIENIINGIESTNAEVEQQNLENIQPIKYVFDVVQKKLLKISPASEVDAELYKKHNKYANGIDKINAEIRKRKEKEHEAIEALKHKAEKLRHEEHEKKEEYSGNADVEFYNKNSRINKIKAEIRKLKHKEEELHHHGKKEFVDVDSYNNDVKKVSQVISFLAKHKTVKPEPYSAFSDLENAINQIGNEAQEVVNNGHQLVNQIHKQVDKIISTQAQPQPTNLVVDAATIIPELADLSAKAISSLGNLVSKLAQTNSLISDGSSIIGEEGALSADLLGALQSAISKAAQPSSLATDGASIIAEEGGLSAKAIADAANAAAPYVKKVDLALGAGASDLGNLISSLV